MVQRQVSDAHALNFLASEGYLPLALADHPGMVEAYTHLFAQTSKFFNLPPESPEKTNYQAASGSAASEEGYSKIPTEKSILTVKTSTHCPETLRSDLQTAWNLTGSFLESVMTAIATTLDLRPDVFSPFVRPCVALPETARTPTLLRMFRYDRPPATAPAPKVTAEPHKDLGMLSLVVGHSPGLQALDPKANTWVSVEDAANLPPGALARSRGLTATLLAGETLAFLSRGSYKAGVHRVVCAPRDRDGGDPYRFSIVYTLRAASAPLFTRDFESAVVGEFGPADTIEGQSAAELFEKIMRAHWNVNAAPSVREEQRRKVGRRSGSVGQAVANEQEQASG